MPNMTKIFLNESDIKEIVTSVMNVLTEEAGVAKDWYCVFEYAANKMWDQLITGSKRLAPKKRKDGSILRLGDRRGPTEAKVHISNEELEMLEKRPRLSKLFPNGLTIFNFFINSFSDVRGWINQKTGTIKLGMYTSYLPVTGEDEENQKQRFIDFFVSTGMHEITHGINGEEYTQNYANEFFKQKNDGSCRTDRPYGGVFDGSNVHDIAHNLLYLFSPGEMNARVSSFYYPMKIRFDKRPVEEITKEESIKNDIKEILYKKGERGVYSPASYISGIDSPKIPEMQTCIDKLKDEKYEAYEESEKAGSLHSIVACLLTYPESFINVRKYGKIYQKGGQKKLKDDAVPAMHDCEINVDIEPGENYTMSNDDSFNADVYDAAGEKVGYSNYSDRFHYDKDKRKYVKNDDFVLKRYTTKQKLSHDDFKKMFPNGSRSGNKTLVQDYPSYNDDQYGVPKKDLRCFSSKIVDEESFEFVKNDMVKQLTNTLDKFKKRVFKVYNMALQDSVDERKKD